MGTRFGSAYRSTKGFPLRNDAFGCFGARKAGDPASIPMNKMIWNAWEQGAGAYYPDANRPFGISGRYYVAGQRHSYSGADDMYEAFRTIIYCDVPDVVISEAKISLGDANFNANKRDWSLVLKKTQDCLPFDKDDAWTFTDLGTIATVANPWTAKYFVEAPWPYDDYYAIDIEIPKAAITPGAPLWVIFSSDKDFEQSVPPEYSQENMVSYALRPQLLLNGVEREP